MPKIRLTAFSFREGCTGQPGDVIECSEADAAYFINANAGELATGSVAEFAPQATEEPAQAEAPAAEAEAEEAASAAAPAEPVSPGGNPKRAKR